MCLILNDFGGSRPSASQVRAALSVIIRGYLFPLPRAISEEDMSVSHHDEQQKSNPVKLAVGIGIGTVALIIAIIMLVQLAVSSYGTRVSSDDPAMAPQAVAKRIAPVAQLAIDPKAATAPAAAATPASAPAAAAPAPAAAPTPAAAAAPTKTADAGAAGKSTYDSACTVCHGAGVAGAPKLGDKAAWAARLAAGKPALYSSAIKGKGAMPPKGGNTALSDDAVKAAVDYMLAAAK
jgi:cytochrome c5